MARLRPGIPLCPSGLIVLAKDCRSGRIRAKMKGMCTWCGDKITAKRRRTWCSKLCERKYEMTQPSVLRQIVENRDGAVCQICRLDCYDMREAMLERAEEHGYEETARWLTDDVGYATSVDAVVDMLTRRRTVYDVDHVEPVSETTDVKSVFDLKNLTTLCHWCHKKDTAQIARRRASRNKADKGTSEK